MTFLKAPQQRLILLGKDGMRALIQELVDIRTGYQPREGSGANPLGEYLTIQVKDIDSSNDHVLMPNNLDRIAASRDLSPYVVLNGDVLFLARGRRRFATLVEGLPGSLVTIAFYYFFILRLRVGYVDPAFLAWVINEAKAQSYLERVSSSTGMPFVTKQLFGALEIRLPSLEKQHEIVRLHRLARRESFLLRKLEEKRSALTRLMCLRLYGEGEGTVEQT